MTRACPCLLFALARALRCANAQTGIVTTRDNLWPYELAVLKAGLQAGACVDVVGDCSVSMHDAEENNKNYFDVRVVLLNTTEIIVPTASWFNPSSLLTWSASVSTALYQ